MGIAALCDVQGERVLQPFKALMKGLSVDPAYHARMTLTHREHVAGMSWRDVPIAELHLPRTNTAWNSKSTFAPKERDKLDCKAARTQLEAFPQLKRGQWRGGAKPSTGYE